MVDLVTLSDDDEDDKISLLQSNESLFKSLIKTVEEIFSIDEASNTNDLHSILETIIEFQKSCDVDFLGSELYRDHLVKCRTDLSQTNAIKKLTVFVQKMVGSSTRNFDPMPILETIPVVKRTAASQSPHDSDSDDLQIIDTKSTKSTAKHPNKRRRVEATKTHDKRPKPSSSAVIKLKGSIPITTILARLPKVARIAPTGTIQQLKTTKTTSITNKINEVVQNHIQKNLSDLSVQFKSCDPAHKTFTLLLERSKGDNSDVWCSSSLAECLKVYKTITDTDFLMRKLHDLLQLKYFKQNPLTMPIALDDENTVVFNMKDYLRLVIFKNGCEAVLPDSHKNMVNIFYQFFTKSTEKQKVLIRKRLEKLPFSDHPQFSGTHEYAATLLTCLNDMIEMLMKTFNEPESDDDDDLKILDSPPVPNKAVPTSAASSTATSSSSTSQPPEESISKQLMEVISPEPLVEMPFPVTDPNKDNNVEPELTVEEGILHMPVEDGIPEVSVEDGILKEPVEEVVEDVPAVEGVVVVPAEKGVVDVPVEEGVVDVSVEDGIQEVPVEEGILKEPVEEEILKEPVEEEILKEPVEEGILKEPVEEEILKEPVEEEILKQPVEEGILKEPVEEEILKEAVEEEILKEPVDKGILKKPVEEGILEESVEEALLEVPVKDGILDVPMGRQAELPVEILGKSEFTVEVLGKSQPEQSAEGESLEFTGVTVACSTMSPDVVTENSCHEIYCIDDKSDTIGSSAEPVNILVQQKEESGDERDLTIDEGGDDNETERDNEAATADELLDLYMMDALTSENIETLTSENMEVERSESPGEKTPEQMDTLDVLEASSDMECEEVMDVGEESEDEECEMAGISVDVVKENKEDKPDKGKRRIILSRVEGRDTETDIATEGIEEAKATVHDTTLLEDLHNYDLEEDEDVPCSQSSVQFVREESNDCFITNVKQSVVQYIAVDHSSVKNKRRKSTKSSSEGEGVIGKSDVERESCEETCGKSSETILKSGGSSKDVGDISKERNEEVGEHSKELGISSKDHAESSIDHAESSKAGNNDTSEDDIDDTTEEYQTQVTLIRKWSRKLGKLSRKIRAVQEADLDIEEMDKWNNLYSQELKLKKRYNKMLKKVKELQGEMEDAEYDFEVSVVCGIPAVETYVQNKINHRQKFPDLQDVSNLVTRVIKRNEIKMKDTTIESLSRQIFLDIGTQIQSHRKREFLLDGGSHLSDRVNTSDDPAKRSKELRSLLKKNKVEAQEKYSNIQTVFATRQFEREMRGDDSSEEDEKTDEEEDKKETEEKEDDKEDKEEEEKVEEKKESEEEKEKDASGKVDDMNNEHH